ncbi:Rab3 GTPase-activating protein non-catalytic subunit [Smittium mucronatum]|uniref:Rab3 GTPase-activating protein non-catalytic subunit n=1 Tax=Smittium mucronatum TaxID=133383 RepID=A0A1R0H7F8_9FUNG|nr:Rab3 GTPase-activating protein non-catalytic subunit [Smittium mucronatum]
MKNLAAQTHFEGPELDSFFSFKKIFFGLPSFLDAVSIGNLNSPKDSLDYLSPEVFSSNILLKPATTRYLVAPPKSMLQLHITTEEIEYSFSAVKFANKVASKVGGVVYNIAKSYLFSSSSFPGFSRNETDYNGNNNSSQIKVTNVPAVISLRDSGRQITRIFLSPVKFHLAALTDTLGRILIIDTNSCDIIAMFKGFRDGQCGWIEVPNENSEYYESSSKSCDSFNSSSSSSILCITLYASRLGLLQVHSIIDYKNPIGTFSIGKGYKLIQSNSHYLGESLSVSNGSYERPVLPPRPASCILINSDGISFPISVSKKSK